MLAVEDNEDNHDNKDNNGSDRDDSIKMVYIYIWTR